MNIKSQFENIQLPDGFVYPKSFMEFIKLEPLPDLKPWWFLHKYAGTSEAWLKTVREQYPNRRLVPFAKMEHTDDVVCFDASGPSSDPIVHYVHTYASPGWEDRGHVINFDAWLKAAIADAQQFKAADEQE
ncbi:hypothetical protein [Hydrogenophaga sp. 5NK40-0174]|uniref:hypothetical protein n=1 Tax=Hydrogenophaga sp. 5NK40-0174 TaxID=3127649 RepID=UPI0031022D70